jgi:diguanylate cyclase (GGDEF)-like protein
MRSKNQEDISINAFELLNNCSAWVLARHIWLVDNMRSILTGETPPSNVDLPAFNTKTQLKSMQLPHSLLNTYIQITSKLETTWDNTIKCSHPLSGSTVFEQLNKFQHKAHEFMTLSKESNQELWHEFAMRDTLTGAWTRLRLNSCLNDELERTHRYNTPCSIALLDQNDFKSINDKYGHIVGDRILSETAAFIQKKLRPNDQLFRYGGDEWLVLMPSTNLENAQKSIARVCRNYAKNSFKIDQDNLLHCSFSYGIATSDKCENAIDWINTADNQLYLKKLQSIKIT